MSPFWILLELKMMEVVGNWSYKTCKAPVNSSPTKNKHPDIYRLDAFLAPKQ